MWRARRQAAAEGKSVREGELIVEGREGEDGDQALLEADEEAALLDQEIALAQVDGRVRLPRCARSVTRSLQTRRGIRVRDPPVDECMNEGSMIDNSEPRQLAPTHFAPDAEAEGLDSHGAGLAPAGDAAGPAQRRRSSTPSTTCR